MGVVKKWLGSIGLPAEVVENFRAAGIVRPDDLLELELGHYEALGVGDANDRKKLFFLVQRLRQAKAEAAGGGDKEGRGGDGDGNGDGRSGAHGAHEAVQEGASRGNGERGGGRRRGGGPRPASPPSSPDSSGGSSPDENTNKDNGNGGAGLGSGSGSGPGSGSGSGSGSGAAAAVAVARARGGDGTGAPKASGKPRPRSNAKPNGKPKPGPRPRPTAKQPAAVAVEAAVQVEVETEVSGTDPAGGGSPARRRRRRMSPPEKTRERARPATATDTAGAAMAMPQRSSLPSSTGGDGAAQRGTVGTAKPMAKAKAARSGTKPPPSSASATARAAGRTTKTKAPAKVGKAAASGGGGGGGGSDLGGRERAGDPPATLGPGPASAPSSAQARPAPSSSAAGGRRRSRLAEPSARIAPRIAGGASGVPSPEGGAPPPPPAPVAAAAAAAASASDRIAAPPIAAAAGSSGSVGSGPGRRASLKSGRSGSNGAQRQSSAPPAQRAAASYVSPPRPRSPAPPRGKEGQPPSGGAKPAGSGSGGAGSTSASGVFVQGAAKDKSWRAQVSRLRESTTRNHNLHLRSVGLNPEDDIGNLDDDGFDDDMRIRVVVRKRPMAEGEASNKEDFDAIHTLTHKDYSKVLVYQPKTRVDLTKEVETIPFAFDNAFDDRSSNVDIYERTVRNLVPSAFEGNHCNVFAYGQTGSGKTFTMMGSAMTGANAGNQDESSPGLYYLAAQDVFCLAEDEEFRHFTITASLFEIYGGKLFDLLNQRSPIKCLEDHRGKVCFPGLTEHAVTDARELMSLIESGGRQRSTGTTSANADSSRSHAVLQLSLKKGRESRPIEHGEQSWGYAFVLPVMVFPRVAFICIIMSIVRSAYFLTFDFRSIFFCFMLLTTSTRAAHLH